MWPRMLTFFFLIVNCEVHPWNLGLFEFYTLKCKNNPQLVLTIKWHVCTQTWLLFCQISYIKTAPFCPRRNTKHNHTISHHNSQTQPHHQEIFESFSSFFQGFALRKIHSKVFLKKKKNTWPLDAIILRHNMVLDFGKIYFFHSNLSDEYVEKWITYGCQGKKVKTMRGGWRGYKKH